MARKLAYEAASRKPSLLNPRKVKPKAGSYDDFRKKGGGKLAKAKEDWAKKQKKSNVK